MAFLVWNGGHRKAQIIQERKDRSQRRLDKILSKTTNAKKIKKAKIVNDKIQKSRYGQTNKQILKTGVKRNIAATTLQAAGAAGLVLSGAAFTAPALATIGAVSMSAAGSLYRTGNYINTIRKMATNYKPNKKTKKNVNVNKLQANRRLN